MRPFWFASCALAGLICFALAAPSPARADDWSKTFKLSGRPNLQVITNDGHVDLYSTDGGQIGAQVTTTGWTIGQHGVRITESQSGNDVTLRVHVPSMNWEFFGFHNRSVHIELRVPREADFDVSTGDGSVTSESFHGQLRISTGDGSMDVHGLKGQVRLHSGDGHINGDDFDGTLRADSGDGHIRVSGRFDTLSIETGDGSLVAEANAGSKVASEWSLRSGDGSVTLRLANGLDADLDAHTGDGHITLDFPVTVSGEISRATIRGKLGSGGLPLIVHTGDGSIHVEKL